MERLKLPKCWVYIAWDYPKAVWLGGVGTGHTEPCSSPGPSPEVGWAQACPPPAIQGIGAGGPQSHPLPSEGHASLLAPTVTLPFLGDEGSPTAAGSGSVPLSLPFSQMFVSPGVSSSQEEQSFQEQWDHGFRTRLSGKACAEGAPGALTQEIPPELDAWRSGDCVQGGAWKQGEGCLSGLRF